MNFTGKKVTKWGEILKFYVSTTKYYFLIMDKIKKQLYILDLVNIEKIQKKFIIYIFIDNLSIIRLACSLRLEARVLNRSKF